MTQFAVVKTGGKQYLVKPEDILFVDRIEANEKDVIDLEKLAIISDEKVELGSPLLPSKIKATVLEQLKADKVRVARFRAKVRYRKVKGFRASMTKIQINSI